MELIEIEAFVAIASTGSFTRAAVALRLSQPAISRRIDLLERELGVPLFERIPTGARLTEAGDAFLPAAQRVLATVRDGASAVEALQTGERGTVALAMVGTLASTRLTARLIAFRAMHPDIRLTLRTARSDEVGALVRRGEAALGLRYFPDPSEGVVSTTVADEALVAVCAGTSRLADADPADPAALAGAAWGAFPRDTGSSGEPFARGRDRQLGLAGRGDAERIVVDSLTAQKRLIEADFGLGLLPISAVEEELRLGSLRRLLISQIETTVPIVLIHRRDGYLSPAARRLMDVLTGA